MFIAKKRDFIGKDKSTIPKKLSVMFQVDAPLEWKYSIIGDSPIKRKDNDEIVGYTTTSTRGARSKEAIAMGYINCDDNGKYIVDIDSELYLDTFGFKWPVKLLENPLHGVNRDVWYKNIPTAVAE